MRILTILSLCALPLLAADPAGKAAYDKACKSCHGADGAGVAAIGKAMKVELRHLGSKEVQAKSDAELKKNITEGVGKMKGVKTLTPKDVDGVVAYVRSMKK